jgi:hypothetical protein
MNLFPSGGLIFSLANEIYLTNGTLYIEAVPVWYPCDMAITWVGRGVSRASETSDERRA